MQLTTLTAGLVALAAAASATPIMGTIKMFYDPAADCLGSDLPADGGKGLAIPPDYVGQCHRIPIGVDNTTYKRFSASGLTPIFSCKSPFPLPSGGKKKRPEVVECMT